MRKLPASLFASLFALVVAAAPATCAVFLSELCDPQNNYTTDRFIEIYNSGPDPVDLTNWSVVAIANNVDVTTWTLSGTIAAGQTRVCGNITTVTGFTVNFQNGQWGSTGYFNWNGKIGDGARLVQNGVTIDLVVATGALFENADLVRIPAVTGPNPVYTPAEWTSTPVLLATDASPGSHNGSVPPTGGPILSDIVTDPATPAAGTPTDVQAGVVDTTGELVGVTLAWGTASSSLPNTIGMTLVSGSTYRTSTPIPAMSGGTTVYYRVQAEGASTTSQSSVLSYTLSGGAGVPPSVLAVGEMSDSTLLVNFSEAVEPVSAGTPANYAIGSLVPVAAVPDPLEPSRVLITVRNLTPGLQTLVVNGVGDLTGDVAWGATRSFNYVDVTIPAGYYDGTAGLRGSALRVALHNLIKNHTVTSYSYAMTAFQTTDVKWNGKVWDVYSDLPGGTPPYEYSFGQTGQGATEGLGYNREHSFPSSWFNGASPMYSDLWILYPTDAKVNGYRSNYAYGVVGTPSVTSLNGSKLGTSASPGFAGTVFEPIDAYKGDLVRSQFYVATRYFNEDGAWPGGPASTGSQLLPWAANQYLQWSLNDPVSWKERMRNGAVYVISHNRNPFVDHPEFAAYIYDSLAAPTAVGPGAAATRMSLRQNSPNPFPDATTIAFDLAVRDRVTLRVFDVAGRLVQTLADGRTLEPGAHQVRWDGRDQGGAAVEAGLYFCRLDTGGTSETRRMVRLRR